MNFRFSLLIVLAFLLLAWLFSSQQAVIFLGAILLLASGLYIAGLYRLWHSAGVGHGLPAWRAGCFLLGMAILALTLIGPLDEMVDQAFSMHMLQHMLLMKVIPPLLLLGEFSPVLLWAVGRDSAHGLSGAWKRSRSLQEIWKQLTSPYCAWILFALCLWVWHIPVLYQAALKDERIHDAEHLMFLGSSLLFWWYLVQKGRDPKVRYGAAVLFLFTTLLHESVLGALFIFSPRTWYPAYASTNLWGLSPLSDQQLAGILMWLPGGLLFSLLIVLYFGFWLQAIERSMPAPKTKLAQTGEGNE